MVAVDKSTIHVAFVFQRKEGPQNGEVDDRADQFWPEERQATKSLERGSWPAQLPNEGDDWQRRHWENVSRSRGARFKVIDLCKESCYVESSSLRKQTWDDFATKAGRTKGIKCEVINPDGSTADGFVGYMDKQRSTSWDNFVDCWIFWQRMFVKFTGNKDN